MAAEGRIRQQLPHQSAGLCAIGTSLLQAFPQGNGILPGLLQGGKIRLFTQPQCSEPGCQRPGSICQLRPALSAFGQTAVLLCDVFLGNPSRLLGVYSQRLDLFSGTDNPGQEPLLLDLLPLEQSRITVKILHGRLIFCGKLLVQCGVCSPVFQQCLCLCPGLLQGFIKHQCLQCAAPLHCRFQQFQHIAAALCIRRQPLIQLPVCLGRSPSLAGKGVGIRQELLPQLRRIFPHQTAFQGTVPVSSQSLSGHSGFAHRIRPGGILLRIRSLHKGRIQGNLLRAFLLHQNGIVHGHAHRPLPVQLLHDPIQLLPQAMKPDFLPGILLRSLDMPHLQSTLQLVEHCFFLCLVGVQLQAEGIQPDGCQPLLHHGQSCHFFRHKQHGTAVVQGIGDHIGNGLGFTRAGRAVEHKALPPGGVINSRQLRGIRTGGHRHIAGGYLGIQPGGGHVQLLRLPGQTAGHETGDYLVLLQIPGTAANIIPHNELAEGELTQKCHFFNIPVLSGHDALPDRIVYQGQIHTAFILRQGIEPVNLDAEVLPQHFQQSHIHLGLLVPDADGIGTILNLPDNIHRNQHQWGIPGPFTFFRFKPPEKAQGKIQRIGAVFLQTYLGLPVQLLEGPFQIRSIHECAQPLALELGFRNGGNQIPLIFNLENLAVGQGQGKIIGGGHNLEILAPGHLILQLAQIRRHQLDAGGSGAEIQQTIPQAQIQKLSLPDGFPGYLLLRGGCPVQCQVNLPGSSSNLRLPTGAVIHRSKFSVLSDAGRNGPDSAAPAPSHINGAPEFRRIFQILRSMLAGMVKIHRLAGYIIRTLHQKQLIDARGQPLGQCGNIILHALGKGFLLQPYPCEGMALDEHQQAVQPHRLQACCIQHRQIQTGAAFLLQHRVGQTHPLPQGLVAGGRHMVCNILLLQCGIDRRRLGFHNVGIAALIAGKGGLSQPFLKPDPRPGSQLRHPGMIGGDKGCNHFRHLQQSRPLVIRQQCDRDVFRMQAHVPLQHLKPDAALHPLRQRKQVFRMHHDPHRRQLHRHPRCQLRQLGFKHMGKFRLKADPDPEVLQLPLSLIGKNQPADYGNVVLLHGKIDGSCHLSIDADIGIHSPCPFLYVLRQSCHIGWYHYSTDFVRNQQKVIPGQYPLTEPG